MHGSLNSCSISNCFSSSRENTISRRGLYRLSNVRTYCFPNDPVPPVIRMDLSLNMQGVRGGKTVGERGSLARAQRRGRQLDQPPAVELEKLIAISDGAEAM